MPSDPRLEVEFSLAGQTFRVSPTWESLVEIERATNQSARVLGMKAYVFSLPLAGRGDLQEISMMEVATVLFCITRGKENAPKTPQAVGEILMEDGYGQYVGPIGDFLTRGQRGNKLYIEDVERQAKKKPDAQPAPEPTKPEAKPDSETS